MCGYTSVPEDGRTFVELCSVDISFLMPPGNHFIESSEPPPTVIKLRH